MKKVLVALTLVLCLLLSACSAAGGKAISDDLLKAFDGTQEEAEKLLNMTPEDSGELTGDVDPGATYARYITVQKLCGRDMEMHITFHNDVVWTFMATSAYPMNDDTKAFAEDCYKQLQKQFGDPYSMGTIGFPSGDFGGGSSNHEYVSGEEVTAYENFWNSEEIRGIRIAFDLPSVPENVYGSRTVNLFLYKDATEYENIQVEINLQDLDRTMFAR